jgi:hypothetical protein
VQGPGGGGGQREGGPTSYRKGFLKRRLPPIYLMLFSSTGGTAGAKNFRVTVTGLSSHLDYLIGVAAVSQDNIPPIEPETGETPPVTTSSYPADPGSFQVTPFVDPPGAPREVYRPVFQDPTATDNRNNPLPMDIPFAWMVSGDDADGCYVDVHIPDTWATGETPFNGSLIFQLVIAYDGQWWDTTALEKAISMVNINPNTGGNVPTLSTGGG